MGNFIKLAKHGAPIVMIGMLLASAFLMLYASRQESATMDELAHIPAAYGYVKYLDYRLNPEHPPLVKILAGIPLLFLKLQFPLAHPAWTDEVNGQWATGAALLYESGNNADTLIQLARLGPILLTLLLIMCVYWWGRKILGSGWALLPALLTAFSPTILAHGHYVTTDVGAALGILAAIYAFTDFLLHPSRKKLIVAGIAFGIAQLLKFSAVLLIPYFFLLIAIFYLASVLRDWPATDRGARLKRFGVRAWRYGRSVFVIFAIGYLVLYPVYFLTTLRYPVEKQVADTQAILASFAGGPPPAGISCDGLRCLAELDVWMAGTTVLRPYAEYLLGVLMVTQRAGGGNTAYFLGEVSAGGWWYYFPMVLLLKEPIPSLLLVLIALLASTRHALKGLSFSRKKIQEKLLNYLHLNFEEFAMLLFIVVYWSYSMTSPLNIGIRHIIPTLPLIYLLTASGIKRWINFELVSMHAFLLQLASLASTLLKCSLKLGAVLMLAFWYIGGTLATTPYYLSYFNEAGGWTFGGYRFVTDSNYDWGQDLKRLAAFADTNGIATIAVDYFGGGDPAYYLGKERVAYWQSRRGNPADIGIQWLAVSINTLQSAVAQPAPGFVKNPEDEYRWLLAHRGLPEDAANVPPPDFRAGTSIFIYKLY